MNGGESHLPRGYHSLSILKYFISNTNDATRPYGAHCQSPIPSHLPSHSPPLKEAEVQAAIPLNFANAALSCSLRTALLVPFGTSFINDRFFLGGSHDMRGFRSLGVGPTDTRAPDPDAKTPKTSYDSIGGDALLAATAALSFDLPHPTLQKLGVHGHVFGCIGNLTPFSDVLKCKSDPKRFAEDFAKSTRATAGVGIVVPTPLGRIEVR